MSAPPKFRFENAPDLPGADKVTRALLGGIRRVVYQLWDVTVEGAKHIPAGGPAIIAPNHLSFCDSVFVPAALPRRAWAIGKGEYLDDWKTKHLFPALGMIPVDRSGGKAAMAALDTAARVLDGGHLFLIYPEGTRSRSGDLHRGRTGAARLAARCDAPIIPVGHEGTLDIQPPDQFLMKTGLPCTVRFGEPIHFSDFGDASDPRVYRAMTDAVMFEISRLSGQSYVDSYAGKTPEQTKVAPVSPADTPRPSIPAGRASPTRPTLVVDAAKTTAAPAGATSAAGPAHS
ncbi:MAG: lysophospholipid acyltransferase family protein [Acidimicrobiales bacterium]